MPAQPVFNFKQRPYVQFLQIYDFQLRYPCQCLLQGWHRCYRPISPAVYQLFSLLNIPTCSRFPRPNHRPAQRAYRFANFRMRYGALFAAQMWVVGCLLWTVSCRLLIVGRIFYELCHWLNATERLQFIFTVYFIQSSTHNTQHTNITWLRSLDYMVDGHLTH